MFLIARPHTFLYYCIPFKYELYKKWLLSTSSDHLIPKIVLHGSIFTNIRISLIFIIEYIIYTYTLVLFTQPTQLKTDILYIIKLTLLCISKRLTLGLKYTVVCYFL